MSITFCVHSCTPLTSSPAVHLKLLCPTCVSLLASAGRFIPNPKTNCVFSKIVFLPRQHSTSRHGIHFGCFESKQKFTKIKMKSKKTTQRIAFALTQSEYWGLTGYVAGKHLFFHGPTVLCNGATLIVQPSQELDTWHCAKHSLVNDTEKDCFGMFLLSARHGTAELLGTEGLR